MCVCVCLCVVCGMYTYVCMHICVWAGGGGILFQNYLAPTLESTSKIHKGGGMSSELELS